MVSDGRRRLGTRIFGNKQNRSGASGDGVKEQAMGVDRSHTKETGWKHDKSSARLEPSRQENKGASGSDIEAFLFGKTTRHRCDMDGY